MGSPYLSIFLACFNFSLLSFSSLSFLSFSSDSLALSSSYSCLSLTTSTISSVISGAGIGIGLP
ncbi:unnamed protein product [Meloidogyne enterolobii]|uniref:Uncharacterized protein n=1 Tax=Meloidogyne enterolobii TaxID=390850 RepID=A0ACB0ZLU0_MELEN